jgi:Holliday junction resolvase RusA-like endonuclease
LEVLVKPEDTSGLGRDSVSFKKRNPHLFPQQGNPELLKALGSLMKDDAPPLKPILASVVIAPTTEGKRQTFTIPIEPVPAPRMTRRDKWLKPRRPCVQRYFDYREALQKAVGDIPTVPDEVHCRFTFSMPESWTKKRRLEMNGKPHRQRPDGDNCVKAGLDALFLEDGGVWKGEFEKRWAETGSVEITMVWR